MVQRGAPTVSVVVAFLNPGRFLEEAIRSVFEQSCDDWELLLVDDGSSDESSLVARQHAARAPERVRYLEHERHENRGVSAARNLGIRHARGEFIAFLDADDVWLPDKLEQQLALLRAHPEAAMVYGASLYWHSWTGAPADGAADRLQPHGIRGNRLYRPPKLLRLFLAGRAVVPVPTSVLVRRAAALAVGGFDESFRSLIDDQVFYAKMCLGETVYVANACWDRYRQHEGSSCAVAGGRGTVRAAHVSYLRWLLGHLRDRGIEDARLRRAVQRELRFHENPSPHGLIRLRRFCRRVTWKLWSRLTAPASWAAG